MQLTEVRNVVWLIGVPIIAALLWSIARRIRAIRVLDAKLRAEEAAQNASRDPYADMARMMNDR